MGRKSEIYANVIYEWPLRRMEIKNNSPLLSKHSLRYDEELRNMPGRLRLVCNDTVLCFEDSKIVRTSIT